MIPLAFIGESILIALGVLGLAFFFMWRMARQGGHGEGLLSLPAKVLLTTLLVGLVAYLFFLGRRGNGGAQALALFMVLLAAFPLVVMWLPSLVGAVLSPFFGSMTGGDEQVEKRPMYFRTIGLRKRGEYAAAIGAAEAELARFPGNLEGLLLIADIRGTDLRDPLGALGLLELTVLEGGRPPGEVALLLSQIADLQLNRLNNLDAARGSLRRIVEEFPGTESAIVARQRLAHLPGEQQFAERTERAKIFVPQHAERVGLEEAATPTVSDHDLALQRAGELVRHLAEFPDDWERREELARIYVDPLGRTDLATGEIEQLIQHPEAQAKHIARWLNEMADLQLKAPDGVATARLTLERITKRFQGTPAAQLAEARLRLLGLDERGKQVTRTIRLGTYEQNLGLKRGDPTIPDPSKGAV